MGRIIFHVDVNNAFLSWTAVDLLKKGFKVDIRKIPSAIAGNQSKRHGIILAKSPVAKNKGVQTATPIYIARKKCSNLRIFAPDYELYKKESDKLYAYLCSYSKYVERYSIDECYLDMSNYKFNKEEFVKLAYKIKSEINSNFGFTVNVGIANNKLCAKMASDFLKPNRVHTLFKEEIKDKLWPLPVHKLYMIGEKTAKRLQILNIKTIADLANSDFDFLQKYFKNSALYMYEYANGEDNSQINYIKEKNKNISMSITLPIDIQDKDELKSILLNLSKKVAVRLHNQNLYAKTISITLRNKYFKDTQRQTKLYNATNNYKEINKTGCFLLDSLYKEEYIRYVGIKLSDLVENNEYQLSLFDENNNDNGLDKVINKVNSNCKNKQVKIVPASYISKK